MKHFLAAVIALLTSAAHAGFLTGVAVGAALTPSGGPAPSPAPSSVVFSDKHDVIACQDYYTDKPRCSNGGRIWVVTEWKYPTHEQYAAQLGYKWIHRKGVIVHGSTTYTIIEVSK